MTWAARLKLGGGLIVVLALVAVLTIVFNQRISQTTSTSASITAITYPIGTSTGGILTHQWVQKGAVVHKGDKLLDLTPTESTARSGTSTPVKPARTPYSVTKNGVTTLLATVDGTVSDVTLAPGGFAAAGATVMAIDAQHSLYVNAELQLEPRDYARIGHAASAVVTLPDQRSLRGTVRELEVTTVNGQAMATAKIEVPGLVEGGDDGLQNPGTPVRVSVKLTPDGVLAGPRDALSDFAKSIGFP